MLLILFPYKLTKSIFNGFQFNDLIKNVKTKIEFQDLSKIINPKWRKNYLEKKHISATEFDSICKWKKDLSKKLNEEKKVYVLSMLDVNSLKSIFIHYILKKLNVEIIQYNSPEVFLPKKKNIFILTFFKAFFLFFTSSSSFFFALKRKIYWKIVLLMEYEKLSVLYSGSQKSFNNYNAKKKEFINFNSSDYSYYLNFKKIKNNNNSNKNKKKKIIFLDSNAPFISDSRLFGLKLKYDVVEWYESLNYFLKKVEKIFNREIAIVPHPRARNSYNQLYDKNFDVLRDDDATIRSIKDCKFVLAISATTAVSFCVIYNKPINFIFNNQMKNQNPIALTYIKEISGFLKTRFINLNYDIYKKDFNLKIDRKAYQDYKFNYLTSKETLKKRNYEILNENFFNK
jgi:hypothetical protein